LINLIIEYDKTLLVRKTHPTPTKYQKGQCQLMIIKFWKPTNTCYDFTL